jgi:hypothetical protein
MRTLARLALALLATALATPDLSDFFRGTFNHGSTLYPLSASYS